ncbi:MAG: hypothetical protein GOMPHAMPRED_007723 [Gomphillus americanus]|uniref:Uncharacterized protein n=1 Tax=Gomphillus americanus TaxID=1940652 RepID=A0A8H3EVZ2_9LECA|nr:MAG: hypothetical protein GOMPHAMPRED_007723 [Gomphillus americanus]
MLFSLLSATILAILHDRMNRSLNGNTVDSNGPWNQQWTSRYATALAFLIRMFFVTCVGTAFVQRQWLNLSTYQQAIRVQNLDVLSNALATPFSLFSHLAWLRNPLLLTIALISWTLPFAAVVTPGTLSVEPRPYTYSANRSALRLSGDDLFLVWVPGQLSEPEVAYLRPSPRLSSLAFTVATASQILSMKSNIANQTYFMNFTGPALKCADANATMIAKLGHLRFDDGAALEYLAWIGDTAPWLQIENSTLQQSILQDYIFYDSAPDVFDPTMENPIESADNTLWIINGDYMNTTSANGPLNVKECQLWNASYETEFTYRNFEPTTVIHGFTYHNPILSISTSNSTIYRTIAQSNYFHKAILAGFGSLIIGADVGNSSKSYQPSILERFGILSARNSTQFGKTLEDNFQNLTMSLFSVPEFLYVPGSNGVITEY